MRAVRSLAMLHDWPHGLRALLAHEGVRARSSRGSPRGARQRSGGQKARGGNDGVAVHAIHWAKWREPKMG